jgi:O-antigen ligase
MSEGAIALYAGIGIVLFILGHVRAIFPYLLLAVLGLEYFSFGGAPDSAFTIPKIGFVALLGSQILSGRYRRALTRSGFIGPLALAVLGLSCTILWSTDPMRSAVRSVSLLSLLALALVVQGFVRREQDLQRFLSAFAAYAIVNALFGASQLLLGAARYVDDIGMRSGGLGVDPNEGAYYTLLGMVVVFGWLRQSTLSIGLNGGMKGVIALVVLAVGLLATASRAAVLVLVVLIILEIFPRRATARSFVAAMLTLVVALAAFAAAAVAFPELFQTLADRFLSSGDDGLGSRVEIWTTVLDLIQQQPLFGYGLSATLLTVGFFGVETYSTHNTPLAILLGAGVFGFTLFILVIARVAALIRRMGIWAMGEDEKVVSALRTALLVTLLMMMAIDLMYNKFLWVVIGLAEAQWQLLKVRTVDHRAPSETIMATVD